MIPASSVPPCRARASLNSMRGAHSSWIAPGPTSAGPQYRLSQVHGPSPPVASAARPSPIAASLLETARASSEPFPPTIASR
jgi:hypothetical protein